MAGPSAPLPQADFIRRIRNTTVTRGDPGAKRIDVVELERALDGFGCSRPGLPGRMLGWLDR